jgi:GTPase SAR1 family protein
MKRYILTGTSGSGKTSIIRELKGKGYPNVNQYRNEEFVGWRWYPLGCLLRQSQ